MKIRATRRSKYLYILITPDGDGIQRTFSFPYHRVKVRSNLVMEVNATYEVKKIVFKLTKIEDAGYLTTLPHCLSHNQYDDNYPYNFRYLIECYLVLENFKELR